MELLYFYINKNVLLQGTATQRGGRAALLVSVRERGDGKCKVEPRPSSHKCGAAPPHLLGTTHTVRPPISWPTIRTSSEGEITPQICKHTAC